MVETTPKLSDDKWLWGCIKYHSLCEVIRGQIGEIVSLFYAWVIMIRLVIHQRCSSLGNQLLVTRFSIFNFHIAKAIGSTSIRHRSDATVSVRYLINVNAMTFVVSDLIFLYSTHWGRVTHICVSNLTIIGSDNGSSPGWRQAIIWINVNWTIRIKF